MENADIIRIIKQGTPEDIASLIEQKKVDVNAKSAKNDSLLHFAAVHMRVDIAGVLISLGANVNARNHNGETPLHIAGSAAVAKILISAGADVNAKNDDRGHTPLHMLAVTAPMRGGEVVDIAKVLIESGADVNAKGKFGDSPLVQAVAMRWISLIKFLVSNGANINIPDNDGWTPLHWAAGADVETAKCLVELGADVTIRDRKGQTPLVVAKDLKKIEIAQYLSGVNTPSASGGCYIATAVYKSYDAPEVLCLRRFRDEVLSESVFGRLFIRLYYLFSPAIAERLKETRRMNMFVRKALDRVVVRLNRKNFTTTRKG